MSQLDLFDPPPAPAESRAGRRRSAPRARPGTQAPPEAAGRRGAAGAQEAAAPPARCPVVRRPICYYDNCRHYQGGRCAHPEAVSSRRRRPARRRSG